jgi:hypothetical protein
MCDIGKVVEVVDVKKPITAADYMKKISSNAAIWPGPIKVREPVTVPARRSKKVLDANRIS